jgi:hypothetical protein
MNFVVLLNLKKVEFFVALFASGYRKPDANLSAVADLNQSMERNNVEISFQNWLSTADLELN